MRGCQNEILPRALVIPRFPLRTKSMTWFFTLWKIVQSAITCISWLGCYPPFCQELETPNETRIDYWNHRSGRLLPC
jgi:hypothetical protein